MESATVTIELTAEDHEAFNSFVLRQSYNWRGLVMFAIAVALIGGGLFFKNKHSPDAAMVPSGEELSGIAFQLLPFGIILPVVWLVLRRQMRKAARDQAESGLFKPILIRISEEGLYEENANFTGTTKWPAFLSLEETADHWFLMRSKQMALPLPKRCFATREEQAIFINQLRLYMDRSRSESAPAKG